MFWYRNEETWPEILAALSKEEIKKAAAPYIYPYTVYRNRTLLSAAVLSSPLEVQEQIHHSCHVARAMQKSRKRKLQDDCNQKAPSKRPWIEANQLKDNSNNNQEVPIATEVDLIPPLHDTSKFLDFATPEELKDCHRRFRAATSNERLAQDVCASCARLLMRDDLTLVDYLSQPNRQLLVPKRPHKSHILTHGMLLVSEQLDTRYGKAIGWICSHCLSALKRNHLPAYSLSNNMWIGPIPTALSMLTIAEQLLIALRYPRGYVFKLYPKAGRDQPDTLQTALKGNVTTYTANAQAVVDMLQGQLMPRATTILPSLIAVTFVGRRSVSKSRLKTIFRVRRKIVHAALLELKHETEHPGYAQLDISREALFLLPEDDVPEEILATLHLELDESVVERESAGYVPPEGNNDIVDELGAHEEDGYQEREPVPDYASLSSIEEQEHSGPEDPDVIPLEFSGTAAADGTQITSKELMLSAIKNLKKELGDRMSAEGAYAVRHGGFARDFGYLKRGEDTSEDTHEDENPSAWTFPSLFPYGVGGLEAKRAVPVSFMEHTRVCLQHYDRRFRRDHMFPYWSMSIQQKRQALNAARLTMGRKDFDRTSAILTQLTEADLTKATQEEETGRSFSDARIVLLRKTVQVTMQKVMGSNASRALNRSKMWSTSLYLNPVNLWMTLNLVDRHDPICQIFAGENIDMDNLQGMLGLSAQDRARNVAEDPFAAAQFFFFLANTILETLFGFTPHARTGDGRMGALGLGNAYYGMVEAQGRGSLHLHMLMWLRDSPHAGEVKLKLQSESFREKIKAYLQANIRSHLDGLTKTVLKSMKSTTELAWSRPPDPDSPTYEVDLKTLETKLVRSQQYHTCAPNTCLVFDKKARRLVCKRRAPFELSPEDVVTETGIIRTKRTVGRLNAWCPAVFYGGRCNNDIKYISNGAEARGYAWYTTNYATKEQGATYNGTGIMTKTWVDHQSRLPTLDNLRENNKSFIFRCGLSLNKEMEYSGQQVMAYLMGWGDSITSHTYTSIYWSLVVRSLKATYPELVSKSEAEKQDSCGTGQVLSGSKNEGAGRQGPVGENEALMSVGVSSGSIHLRSQIDDYRFRGEVLKDVSFLEYFVDTYEEQTKAHSIDENIEPQDMHAGCPKNTRVPYQKEHPRASTSQRVMRCTGHRNLPNIVGPWIERSDNPETNPLHCASVLALLKPWNTLEDLKIGHTSWSAALESYISTASVKHQSICANIQYYYECRKSAGKPQHRSKDGYDDADDDVVTAEQLSEMVNGIEIDDVLISPQKQKELDHAEKAVAIGRRFGVFGDLETTLGASCLAEITTADDIQYDNVSNWTTALKKSAADSRAVQQDTPMLDDPDAGDIDQLILVDQEVPAQPTIDYEGDIEPPPAAADIDITMLATDQLRAFKAIQNHVTQNRAGKNPPQLLMQIQGEGGTGKSLVIKKVTEYFKLLGIESSLRRLAYTGIAASLIEGSTLHQLALIHLASKPPSQKTSERLQTTWSGVQYLIIDEVSMISKKTLYYVSKMIGIGKQRTNENNSTVAFGGVNIILAGDFHQFPPIVGSGKGRGALYSPSMEDRTEEAVLGRGLYERFTSVVLLTQQFRNKDTIWQGILHRLRYGACTADDLATVRSMILSPDRDKDLFTQEDSPWKTAVLVTPRHSVRNKWNALASRNHCRRTNQKLICSNAYDTFQGKPLDRDVQKMVNARAVSISDALPDTVQLAKGMPVLVTYNVETELDIANGSRATIERIIAHPDSELPSLDAGDTETIHLSRPPLCVLVRLARTKAKALEGLEPGVVPIIPIRSGFQIPLASGQQIKLQREQLPLTPAYAFTDYRSQGQSIPYVIIDIGKPPSSAITPFNAYVALSRSIGRENARLLWDFEDRLFTAAPDKNLTNEDEELERLNKATKSDPRGGKRLGQPSLVETSH